MRRVGSPGHEKREYSAGVFLRIGDSGPKKRQAVAYLSWLYALFTKGARYFLAEKLKIIPLGGLDEIGKNITVLEYGKDMIVRKCTA